MKKETSSKILNIFGWLKIIGAILIGLIAVCAFTNLNNETFIKIAEDANIVVTDGSNISPVTILGIAFAFIALLNLAEGLLLKRAAKDGKKSTLLIILTILSTATGAFGLIKAFSTSNLVNVLIDAFILYLLFNGRKEN